MLKIKMGGTRCTHGDKIDGYILVGKSQEKM
jgi:hypothetical protein